MLGMYNGERNIYSFLGLILYSEAHSLWGFLSIQTMNVELYFICTGLGIVYNISV